MSSFRQVLKVRRMVGGERDDNGRWVEGSEATIRIRASVQPATPKDLMALEEGRRNRATFVLFTSTRLETVDTQNPYRVKLFGSDDYEVVGVEAWQNGVRPHFRILAQKINATAET